MRCLLYTYFLLKEEPLFERNLLISTSNPIETMALRTFLEDFGAFSTSITFFCLGNCPSVGSMIISPLPHECSQPTYLYHIFISSLFLILQFFPLPVFFLFFSFFPFFLFSFFPFSLFPFFPILALPPFCGSYFLSRTERKRKYAVVNIFKA